MGPLKLHQGEHGLVGFVVVWSIASMIVNYNEKHRSGVISIWCTIQCKGIARIGDGASVCSC